MKMKCNEREVYVHWPIDQKRSLHEPKVVEKKAISCSRTQPIPQYNNHSTIFILYLNPTVYSLVNAIRWLKLTVNAEKPYT